MKKIALILVMLMMNVSLLVPDIRASVAVEPLDILKTDIDKVISILNDPQYQASAQRKLQKEKIWEIVSNIFDFDIIAKLALGRNRHRFNPKQLDEFIDLFSKLLKNTYIDKLQGEYRNVRIKYLSQEFRGDSTKPKAIVRTLVLRDNLETPMDYSMRIQNDQWKIYDVRIEKVSLVKNYREQFDEILFRESPLQLIKRLQKKIKEQTNNE